ncbi:MAG: hypothetical protein GDA36_05495 [Rhodobacteraceae bacterium]|nr:hypothetical protein [Paracoccaceae bacterium]
MPDHQARTNPIAYRDTMMHAVTILTESPGDDHDLIQAAEPMETARTKGCWLRSSLG